MSYLAKALLRAAFAMLLAAVAANAQNPSPTPSPDQRPRHCGGTIYIGGQTAKPLTAKRTTKATTILPDGTRKLTEWVEFLARDSDGRVRIERPGIRQPAGDEEKVILHTRDGGKIETTREAIGSSIRIFDCPGSEMILLQPGMQVAHVTKLSPPAKPNHPLPPFSFRVTNLLSGKPRPDISVEDLGYRDIEVKFVSFGKSLMHTLSCPFQVKRREAGDSGTGFTRLQPACPGNDAFQHW